MKTILALSILSALAVGYAVGTHVEANTQALQVARITGQNYFVIVNPVGRMADLGDTVADSGDDIPEQV